MYKELFYPFYRNMRQIHVFFLLPNRNDPTKIGVRPWVWNLDKKRVWYRQRHCGEKLSVYTATGLVLDCRSDEHVDFTFWWGQGMCVCVCVCVCVCARVHSDVTLSGAMYSTEYSWMWQRWQHTCLDPVQITDAKCYKNVGLLNIHLNTNTNIKIYM